MPATEQTWRDQKKLHLYFGLSCLALLVSTIWMLVADHRREWKQYATTSRRIDVLTTTMRQEQFKTDQAAAIIQELERRLAEERGNGFPDEALTAFRTQAEESGQVSNGFLNTFDANQQSLAELAKTAGEEREKVRQARDKIRGQREELTTAEEEKQKIEQEANTLKAQLSTLADDAKAPVEAELNAVEGQLAEVQKRLDAIPEQLAAARTALSTARAEMDTANEAVGKKRDELVAAMRSVVDRAKVKEDIALSFRKFTSANLDAAKANVGLLVRDDVAEDSSRYRAAKEKVARNEEKLAADNQEYETAAAIRNDLQKIVDALVAEEAARTKDLDDAKADLDRLETSIKERRSEYTDGWGPGKRLLELPILDAFNSPAKIDNIWSEGLLQGMGSFRDVRRYDRCTTCHQAIDKTMPGTATEPAYEHQVDIEFTLLTSQDAAQQSADEAEELGFEPPTAPESADLSLAQKLDKQLLGSLGLRLSEIGVLNEDDVTISLVMPHSLAAQASSSASEESRTPRDGGEIATKLMQPSADIVDPDTATQGLLVGDVIAAINGDPVHQRDRAIERLLDAFDDSNEKSVQLTIRRGLPHPYASHPRLDLFVGSLSPHPKASFGCTICHEGQGSATAFKWASHAPDSVSQKKQWTRDHGWFDNHHWIFPMYSKRFAESSCLKCHHGVTELATSAKFPTAPAPKLTRGHDLIRKYGCFGCHEVNGYDGPTRIGPDMRLAPIYSEVAQQLRSEAGYGDLDREVRSWVEQLIQHPELNGVRHRLLEYIQLDGEKPVAEREFSADAHQRMLPLLADVDSPGKLRKVGPTLRYVKHKLDPEFLYDWINRPGHFRPTTRMPQFFGLWNHLKGKSKADAKRYEAVEVFAVVQYLMSKSQSFSPLPPAADITRSTADEQLARGKREFRNRCLACHSHEAFPDMGDYREAGKIQQGPDLSGIGSKFDPQRNPVGIPWLYSWIKQPTKYHPRTLMPDSFLDPIEHKDAEGNVTHTTDPVADIVSFLLASKTDWQPADDTLTELNEQQLAVVDELTTLHLQDSFFVDQAAEYASYGIPNSEEGELKGAEKELLVADADYNSRAMGSPDRVDAMRALKLNYIGRKAIAKWGCYGCHDVPGFEEAKPIGTGLADWGRKEPAKLAFEHIEQYLHHSHGGHGHADDHAEHGEDDEHAADESAEDPALALEGPREHPPEFYAAQIHAHNRIGFLYQKLLEPRSYDYHKTETKKYNERLRMPQFPFSHGEREEVMTFVLGLVADPPTDKYVYRPDERAHAILEGQRVLSKFNCSGCHMLQGEQLDIAYTPDAYGPQQRTETFPFALHRPTAVEREESRSIDFRNRRHSQLVGLPTLDNSGRATAYDSEGDPIQAGTSYDPTQLELSIDLWKPTVIDGDAYQVGDAPVSVPVRRIRRRAASRGGDLARFLLPHALADERQTNPNAKPNDAWGWMPPPLIGEGEKVQTDWLHSFLLDPFPIRPAVVLRMPKFNMTAAEATALANYFAAVDNTEYPYNFVERRTPQHLESAEREFANSASQEGTPEGRLAAAMNIVTDNNYCVKCHLVGDFEPKGAASAKAPNLAGVYRRLRPDYLRQWIAKPTSKLPYTGMPVNIPFKAGEPNLGGIPQKLFHGTSVDQVDGLVDLLMNYDRYSAGRAPIAPMVKPPDPNAAPTTTGAAGGD